MIILLAVKTKNGKLSIPWIGEYIVAIYKYAIGIVGILAAVVLMFGGVLWITAGGNNERISNAKSWIAASLSGLVLALCSYMILYTINPNLVKFEPIEIVIVNDNTQDMEVIIVGCCYRKDAFSGAETCDDTVENECSDPENTWKGPSFKCNKSLQQCEKQEFTGGASRNF